MGILLVSAGIGQTFRDKNQPKKYTPQALKTPSPTSMSSLSTPVPLKITIDISGSVVQPGVYTLPKGSRVQDGLILAGGLSSKADRTWVAQNINLAKSLVDEEKIYIPNQQESIKTTSPITTNQATSSIPKKPSINTGTLDELISVNGIGPATAKLIIDWRNQNGPFKVPEDLGKIPGIGAKSLAKILPQVTL